MTMPLAYDPAGGKGNKYQILHLGAGQREYDHLDYAADKKEKDFLMQEYRLAYRNTGSSFKVITLPKKYWKVS